MLIHSKMDGGKNVEVRDFMGKVIPLVKSFDTETLEAELYISAAPNAEGKRQFVVISLEDPQQPFMGEVLTIKVKLPGCKAYNKLNGREITSEEDLFDRSSAV